MKEKEQILKEIVKEINEPILTYEEKKIGDGLFINVKLFNEDLDKFILPNKDSFVAHFSMGKKSDYEFKRYVLFWINERTKYLWDNNQKISKEQELKDLHHVIGKSKKMIDDLDKDNKSKN